MRGSKVWMMWSCPEPKPRVRRSTSRATKVPQVSFWGVISKMSNQNRMFVRSLISFVLHQVYFLYIWTIFLNGRFTSIIIALVLQLTETIFHLRTFLHMELQASFLSICVLPRDIFTAHWAAAKYSSTFPGLTCSIKKCF